MLFLFSFHLGREFAHAMRSKAMKQQEATGDAEEQRDGKTSDREQERRKRSRGLDGDYENVDFRF